MDGNFDRGSDNESILSQHLVPVLAEISLGKDC